MVFHGQMFRYVVVVTNKLDPLIKWHNVGGKEVFTRIDFKQDGICTCETPFHLFY